jgi:hypothetical protein
MSRPLLFLLAVLAGVLARRSLPDAVACPAPLDVNVRHDLKLATQEGIQGMQEAGTLDIPGKKITFADGTSLEFK